MKKTSQKMIIFFVTAVILIMFYLLNAFVVKSEAQGQTIIWGVVVTAGAAMTNKFLDDWQKSKYFQSELNGGEGE